MGRQDLGLMIQPEMWNKVDTSATVWAADTGSYKHPERFDEKMYLTWLANRDPQTCLFATAPDVPYDMNATLAKSLPLLPKIRALGYKAGLVAQDGVGELPWSEFDALFMGGTTKYKLSEDAYELVAEARRRGKWTHMGRVNSWSRLKAAAISGYQSADGTLAAFGPDKWTPMILEWAHALRRQPWLAL